MKEARKHFGTLAEEIAYQQEVAEYLGDEERLEAANDVCAAVRSVGLSASSIRFSSEEESDEGHEIALASYNPANDRISAVGSAQLSEGAKSAGMKVREYTKTVLEHEQTHQKSRKASGAGKVDAVLTHLFGEKAVHVTEEAAASQLSGSDRFDTYDHERAEAARYAGELRITTGELLRIRAEGDAEALGELLMDKAA